ncbi:class I adenylate-forming enzyme family protein [Microbispora triticiradicis]|uniref:Acyl--CoA ligase n=1 Tax=Microbispora triticiradicis TaxID=2200763 RepID=A0A5R8YH60_9ACTN|nr:class I adenylate-forming enzyme family protein [Microbispora fusca]TLP50914.1 acyl--CoA ligase [Microbispora fusca]
MPRKRKNPRNLGLLFETHRGATAPVFELSRPFDLHPDGGTTYRVGRLADLVARTSAALHAAGVRASDRVAICKANHFDVVLLAAAAARIGALPAMISDTVPPEALRTLLGRLEAKVLVVGDQVLAGATREGVALDDGGVRLLTVGSGDAPAGSPPRLAGLMDGPVPPARPVADDEPMICTHTSGTTGVPKLVVHSANTLGGVITRLETMRIPYLSTRPDDTIAACIAFVHGRSAVWAFAQLGLPPAKAVVLADSDPESVIATLREHPPTTLEACPNIFQRWEALPTEHPELFSRIRAYLNTFDLVHPRTVRSFLNASPRRGVVWGQSWGQSETGPVTLGIYTRRSVRRSGISAVTSDVGRPIPLVTKVRVVDPKTRRPVPRGQQGIVLVRTKGRCLTYLGEADRHAEKNWDGYWNTGDIGVHTRMGKIILIDREVDSLPNMSGIEVESLLLDRLPQATEVIVLGVPGREPVPIISTVSGELDPGTWGRVTGDLPPMEQPKVIAWEDFPRTGTWKVRRPELRRRLLHSSETFGTGAWT